MTHLRIIEGAKEQGALGNKKDAGAAPTSSDPAPNFKGNVIPGSAAGETYRINPVGTPASAKSARDVGVYQAGAVSTNY